MVKGQERASEDTKRATFPIDRVFKTPRKVVFAVDGCPAGHPIRMAKEAGVLIQKVSRSPELTHSLVAVGRGINSLFLLILLRILNYP